MAEVVLKMENINKSFGETKVLKDVHIELRKGEVHALAGGNGAGKSTLMKIMTGVYTKDTGEITMNGKSVKITNSEEANSHGIAMIFQELSLVQPMTIAENIFLGSEIKSGIVLDKKEMNARAIKVLSDLGLSIDPNMNVESLSVGLSQMVEIAKAVNKEAKILVLDEPTASLSENETSQLFKLIADLKAKGVTMVYISHRMNEIMEIADRITILKDGENALTDEIKNVSLEHIVSYFVGGSSEESKFQWIKREFNPNGKDVLKVENLHVDNKIKDISFSVKEGEIVGIAGLMGSGRTEILECLFGIRHYQSGTIEVGGKPVKVKKVDDAIKAGLGLVPEDRRKQGLVLQHTVRENTILPTIKSLLKSKMYVDNRKADELTRQNVVDFNVKTSSIHKTIGLLSGGNQQKVVIAKWLNSHPKVMLLDEPTAGVDIGAKSEIIDIIRGYADKGNGVVFVSSELAELLAACDRVLVLYDGKIMKDITREEIRGEEELQHAIQAGE